MACNFNDKTDSASESVTYEDVSDLTDLWTRHNQVYPTIPPTPIVELQPQAIAVYDSRNQSVILSKTNDLHKSLFLCDRIVDACFKVANYVPDLSRDQNASFWIKDVIPILSKNIINVGRARVIVSHSISSVRQLGIAIFKGAEIINETKGSPKAVEIARKDISASLRALDKWIGETQKLECSLSIAIFENQIADILKIMGPEAGNFLEERSIIETEIHAEEAKQKQLFVDIARKEGEVARYRHLYLATKKHVERLDKTVETNEARIDILGHWNEETEQKIHNIQASTFKFVRSVEYEKWWRWWSDKRKRNYKTTSESIPNAGRDKEKDYYEGIILQRMRRLRHDQNNLNSERTMLKALNEDLGKYYSELKAAENEMRFMSKDLKIRMANHQREIDKLIEKLEYVKRRQDGTEKYIGLQAHVLVQCLTDIRICCKTIEKGSSMFTPLVAVLGDIRQMVQSDIELLSSDFEIDINIAARRLMNQVQFLSRYAVDADEILNPPSELPIEAPTMQLNLLDSAVPSLPNPSEERRITLHTTKRQVYSDETGA